MQERLRKIGLCLVAVGLCLALLVSGAIPVCEAGPEGKERVVKMGLDGIFTGPLATIACPWGEGVIDYARYVNEQGGIDGINVEVPWYETRGTVPDSITSHRKLAQQGMLVEHQALVTIGETLLPLAMRDEIPIHCLSAPTYQSVSKPQWIIFTGTTDWATIFMSFVKWYKENKWTEARPLRLGYIFYDQSSGWFHLETTKYFERIGVEFVGYEVVPILGCLDTSTELLRLANKKADLIYVTSYGMPTVVIAKDAKRLGLQDKGITFMASPNTMDECTVNVVKTDADGWLSIKLTPCAWETEVFPGLKPLIDAARRYRGYGPEEVKGFYMAGWQQSAVAVEAIRLAMEKVGYENLTGRAVRDAHMTIKDFPVLQFPVTITEDEPGIVSSCGIYPITEAKFQSFEAWIWMLPCLVIKPGEFEAALEKPVKWMTNEEAAAAMEKAWERAEKAR